MNDLHLVLASEECEHFRCGAEWTVVSDGRWDHNPGSGEVQLALALDHLDCECTFTMSVLRAAFVMVRGEAPECRRDSCNAKGLAAGGRVASRGQHSPPQEALAVCWRHFQTILVVPMARG